MKKHTNNRTMSFRRLLALLLGLVLFMELLPGGLTVVGDASDAVTVTVNGAKTAQVTLPQSGRVTMEAASETGDTGYQWQIQLDGDWVSIYDATAASLTLTYAMVSPALEKGSAMVRCAVGGESASDPIKSGEPDSQKVLSPTYLGYAPYWSAEDPDTADPGAATESAQSLALSVGADYTGETYTVNVYYKAIAVSYAVRYYFQNIHDDMYSENVNLYRRDSALTGTIIANEALGLAEEQTLHQAVSLSRGGGGGRLHCVRVLLRPQLLSGQAGCQRRLRL